MKDILYDLRGQFDLMTKNAGPAAHTSRGVNFFDKRIIIADKFNDLSHLMENEIR